MTDEQKRMPLWGGAGMSITDVIESNRTKRRAWFSSGFWLPAGHSVVVVDSADPDVDGSAEVRERNEILQQLNRIAQQQRWIPVGERLPKSYLTVLSLSRNKDIKLDFVQPKNIWYLGRNNVTHWMPLPELPKKEVQG